MLAEETFHCHYKENCWEMLDKVRAAAVKNGFSDWFGFVLTRKPARPHLFLLSDVPGCSEMLSRGVTLCRDRESAAEVKGPVLQAISEQWKEKKGPARKYSFRQHQKGLMSESVTLPLAQS